MWNANRFLEGCAVLAASRMPCRAYDLCIALHRLLDDLLAMPFRDPEHEARIQFHHAAGLNFGPAARSGHGCAIPAEMLR